MATRGRARNWRLEAVAWLAAIALVVAALAFSSGSDDESSATPDAGPVTGPEVHETVEP